METLLISDEQMKELLKISVEKNCTVQDVLFSLMKIYNSIQGNNVATMVQLKPTGDGVSVTELVIDDLRARSVEGEKEYGTPLKTNNGRDAMVDAYQEALDLCQYLRQAIEERW